MDGRPKLYPVEMQKKVVKSKGEKWRASAWKYSAEINKERHDDGGAEINVDIAVMEKGMAARKRARPATYPVVKGYAETRHRK